jgi:hypothetical protein
MKNQRISKVANFFAFNLLFFALYLNFIHQDANTTPDTGRAHSRNIQGTILVENPELYLNKAAVQHPSAQQTIAVNEQTSALKLSFN